MSVREQLAQAWGLASLPMAAMSYTQAVLQFVGDGQGGICPRALLMYELAIEIHQMGESFDALHAAWPHRRRSDTAPMTPSAIRADM